MAGRQQRYISDELTHFVGRGVGDRESQYQLLVSIVRSGILEVPGGSDITFGENTEGPLTIIRYSLSVQHERSLSSNEKYLPSVICFADIPVEDLSLHVGKYSAFGLSFLKRALLNCGANPVFYVAGSSPTQVRNPLANQGSNSKALIQAHRERGALGHWENFSRAELFDAAERAQQSVLPTYVGRVLTSGLDQSTRDIDPFSEKGILRDFLAWYLFPFMKFFDPPLSDDDPSNYYMEREWRVIGAVPFVISEIERILIPREFAQRLRADLPSYCGQVTFV